MSEGPTSGAPRPRPGITPDTSFFWEGVAERRLRIQRCVDCSTLRHPPGPACPKCGSLAADHVEASGRGLVHSFVVVHHPKVPAFDYPHPVALVELEEGTRFVADLVGIEADAVEIGMPVEVEFHTPAEGQTLPRFRPVADAG